MSPSVQALLTVLLSSAAFLSGVLGDSPLDLGFARPYAILAATTVTSTGVVGTVVMGSIGVFPGTAVTGFPPAVLSGSINAANSASGSALGSLTTAFNIAAAKPVTKDLSNMDLGGMILLPGVYKFDDTAALNGALTLNANGNPNAVWTFQIANTLLIAESSTVGFKNGVGNPDYVYWQVGTSATLAKSTSMVGNILAYSAITVNDGASVQGRCLALNAAVTLDNSVVQMPV